MVIGTTSGNPATMHESSAMPKGSRKVSSAEHVIDKVTLNALVNHARFSTLLTKVAYFGNTSHTPNNVFECLPTRLPTLGRSTQIDSDHLRSIIF